MRISRHCKERLLKWGIINSINEIDTLLEDVDKEGKTPRYFRDKDAILYHYLINRLGRGGLIKVYQNNIYVYTILHKKLITVYPLPQWYEKKGAKN